MSSETEETKKPMIIVKNGVIKVKNGVIKAINVIKERRKRKAQEKKAQEEELMEKAWIMLTPEEIEELESAAYAMSRKWKYRKLMQAADIEASKFEGREVHGWMQRMFRYRYGWLVDNDVFDLAVNYAFMYYQQEIFNVIKNYDFGNAIINVINLPRKTHFDIYSDFNFDKIIVLTQDEPFENAVHWIENHPWVDESGYKTTKTLAPCNLLNTGFTLWDLPVTVLKDTVGKDKLFFQAVTTADQITNVRDQILKEHIYNKRQEELTTNEKVLEMQIKYDQLKKRHQYLIDDIKAGDTRNPEEKLKDFAKKYDREVVYGSKYRKVVLWIILAFLVVFVFVGLILMYAPKPEPDVPDELDVIGALASISTLIRGV